MKHKKGCCLFPHYKYLSFVFRFFVFVFGVLIPFQVILVFIIDRLRRYLNRQSAQVSSRDISNQTSNKPSSAAQASITIPNTPAQDDLLSITGIGKKAKDILYENGITSYAQLAKMTVEKINLILETSGSRVRADQSWIEQAKLKV